MLIESWVKIRSSTIRRWPVSLQYLVKLIQQSLLTQSHYHTNKIFVGGLPTDITEQEFRNFLGQFGEVADSVIDFNPESQRTEGFGFISCMSVDAVELWLHDCNLIS
jgi:hypothetical protein